MGKKKRGKNVRKQRRESKTTSEVDYSNAPHSFVFTRPNVGPYVKALGRDFRKMLEPFTATKLKATRKNVLKDFISITGPYNVSHVMYFTHPKTLKNHSKKLRQQEKSATSKLEGISATEEDGKPFFHMIRSPHGPSFTFRIENYSLAKDIVSLVQRAFSRTQYFQPPLLVMTGFSSKNDSISSVLRLTVDMFQNMLPPLNVQNLKLSSVRRVLLISREEDVQLNEEFIYIRHYHIRTEDKSLSKPLRRLGLGGNSLRKKNSSASGLGPSGFGQSTGVPNLGKYRTIEEYLTKAGLTTDSGMSDFDEALKDVELPSAASSAEPHGIKHGLPHLTGKKAAIKLIEIGPRLKLKLIKIEEGVNDGNVLYHSLHARSVEQVMELQEKKYHEKRMKEERKIQQQNRRLVNEKKRDEEKANHKAACLAGMAQESESDAQSEESAEIEDSDANAQPVSKKRKLSSRSS